MKSLRLLCLFGVFSLSGCSTVSFYWQAIGGHFELMRARQAITEVLAAPETDESLRSKLRVAESARSFAINVIGLPDNGSYTRYADIGRPYLLWNVVATPEFDLTPKRWCAPIAGCVSYRGYFARRGAERLAIELRERGHDVSLSGVVAYSTLGWFEDPVISTMMAWPNHALAGLIIHELAHQKLYLKGDTEFNEAFATAVERLGRDQWLVTHGSPADLKDARARDLRRRDFIHLVRRYHERLAALYAGPLSRQEQRRIKAKEFEAMRGEYAMLKDQWGGYSGYDAWFENLNNARLTALATYHELVPPIAALFQDSDQDWSRFFKRLQPLERMDKKARRAWLAQWTEVPTSEESAP